VPLGLRLLVCALRSSFAGVCP